MLYNSNLLIGNMLGNALANTQSSIIIFLYKSKHLPKSCKIKRLQTYEIIVFWKKLYAQYATMQACN